MSPTTLSREQLDRIYYMRAFDPNIIDRTAPMQIRPFAPTYEPKQPKGPMAVKRWRINWLAVWTGFGALTFVVVLGVAIAKGRGL